MVVPISALNQYAYCPRRCALIHVEQMFEDNIYTMRGHHLHERTDQPEESGWEGGIRVERALPLWSKRLGLIGKADIVEFHDEIPYPVEYKSGRYRQFDNDDLQLCAQALCLEEMTGKAVPRGAIFHHSSRRRREVIFDQSLRSRVLEAAAATRQILVQRIIPPPVKDKRCDRCSLKESCMPGIVTEQIRTKALVRGLFTVGDP
ncbi:MAG: CRISPR-associated protein Cas4 [Nitrospiraceae bacterium]